MKDIIDELAMLEGDKFFAHEKEKRENPNKPDYYFQLEDLLDENGKELLNKVYLAFFDEHIEEVNIYYKLGLQTGFHLAKEIFDV